MTTKQYTLMLNNANVHLEEIKNQNLEKIDSDESFVEIAQKIRYFSVDMESALDYIAFDLFSCYFLPIMKKEEKSTENIESKLRNVSFPNYKDEQVFNKRIKNIFPRLHTLHPEIFTFLKELQPFKHQQDYAHWLTNLNTLVNTNKHRHLSKTQKNETADIKYLKTSNGNVLENVSLQGGPRAIAVGDTRLTNKNAHSLGIIQFEGNINTNLVFKDDGTNVIETLENIYFNEKKTIETLSYFIEKI